MKSHFAFFWFETMIHNFIARTITIMEPEQKEEEIPPSPRSPSPPPPSPTETDLNDLSDQVSFIDGRIQELYSAIAEYEKERRNVMHKIVSIQYTRDDIIALTQSSQVKHVENCEVLVYNGYVQFESYYWLPNFKLLIKAKIPVTHQFLQNHDIPSHKEHRNWPLLSEFVTFELFE